MKFLKLFVFNFLILTIPRSEAREILAVGSPFYGIFEATDTGVFVGLGPDLLRAIVERMGDQVRFAEYPWARAQMKVEQGQADILIGPYKNPQRERRFIYATTPFFQDRMFLFCSACRLSWSGNFAAFSNKKIGYMLGWAYGSSFEDAKTIFHAVRVTDVNDGLSKLLKGHIDLLASNRRTVEKWLETHKSSSVIQALEPHLSIQQGYFVFPKNPQYESYRQRFDEAFHEIFSNGTLERLARKYDVEYPDQKH